MEKSRKPVLGVGTSSILLIFVLLCLITFAVLSLVSARSDYRLSKKNADHVEEYYQAQNKANQVLAHIETVLEEQYSTWGDTDRYAEEVRRVLEGTEYGITFPSQREISYQIPAGDSDELLVTLLLPENLTEGDSYCQIKSWKLVNTETWQPDETLPVYGSEEKELQSEERN